MVGGGIKQQQAEGGNGARRSLRRASLEEAAEAEGDSEPAGESVRMPGAATAKTPL